MDLGPIAQKEYLGRGLAFQANKETDVLLYFVTGRSESSRARRLIFDGDGVRTVVTDQEQLKTGNPLLLLYPALQRVKDQIVLSNGLQTETVANTLRSYERLRGDIKTKDMLRAAFSEPDVRRNDVTGEVIDLCSYEPDPSATPRITLLYVPGKNGFAMPQISMAFVSKGAHGAEQQFFPKRGAPEYEPGKGWLLTTYEGTNVPEGELLPSSDGSPNRIALPDSSAEDIADVVFDALGPKDGPGILKPGLDMRVGVLVHTRNRWTGEELTAIKDAKGLRLR